ncbi:MAG: KH domain-containing protein [Candidatus Diapherotrites archaeon]
MKKFVVPGDLVSEERKRLGSFVYLRNGKIYSQVLGIADNEKEIVSVVPVQGKYLPRMGDLIIGIVSSEKATGYMVDINSFQQSFVSKKDIREELQKGNVVTAKLLNVNEMREASLDQPRVFYGGEILTISPVKVPRVIGKNGSMLDVLKQGTGCSILVGRNGWIWAKGGNTQLLQSAVEKIELEAHLPHLTEKMQAFLNVKPSAAKPVLPVIQEKPPNGVENPFEREESDEIDPFALK